MEEIYINVEPSRPHSPLVGLAADWEQSLKAIEVHGTAESTTILCLGFSLGINIWSQLEHENVLPTSYSLTLMTEDTFSLEMVSPWMKNGNVRNYLKKFPDTNRRELMTDVAAGMNYLHQSGVVHGALNPANVVIDDARRPLLADFGIASVLETNRVPLSLASSRRRLSFGDNTGIDNVYATSLVSSTRPVCRYMAPELLNNERSYSTTASDVYMFACLCYESFVETPPFADLASDIDVLRAIHRHELPSRPPIEHPAHSRGLDDFMWNLMESCWNSNLLGRPTMDQVYKYLRVSSKREEHGGRFKAVPRL